MNFSSPSSNLVPGVGQTYWVGSCFFLSAILTTIAFTLSVIGWFRLKLSCNAMQYNATGQYDNIILSRLGGKDISELDEVAPQQPSYRQNKENNPTLGDSRRAEM